MLIDKRHTDLNILTEVKPSSMIFEMRNALPGSLCEKIIRHFEDNPDDQYQGRIGQTVNLNTNIKKSTDIFISGKPHWQDIDNNLLRSLTFAMNEFREAFPYFKNAFKDTGYGIQRTLPGEHYHWHIDGGSHDFSARQLVAIWYLNTVSEPGGETEFLVQDVRIKPEQGKLVLFPPFWTHEHRGVTLTNGVKYIATTWIVFA